MHAKAAAASLVQSRDSESSKGVYVLLFRAIITFQASDDGGSRLKLSLAWLGGSTCYTSGVIIRR